MSCVRKRGAKWTAQVRVSGWRSFTKTFAKKSDAVLWSNELETRLRAAPLPTNQVNQKILLADLLLKYADEISPTHKGVVSETYRLKSVARRWIGKLDIRYLNKYQFIQYRDDRLEEVSGDSVCAELNLIKRVLDTADKIWNIGLPSNPVKEVSLPKKNKSRARRLATEEKVAILNVAQKLQNPYIAPAIEFAIETAMRRSELLAIKWTDVCSETGFAKLHDTKNGERRTVPLTARARCILDALDKNTDYVFPISATCLHQAFKRVIRKTGIQDLRFHDLRHEAVSRFFEIGMSVPEVALISGHKDMTQLFRYTHLNPNQAFQKYDLFN